MSAIYPTMEQVEEASAVDIVRWLRHLPSPDDEHRPILDRIIERNRALTDEERVAASKTVGW